MISTEKIKDSFFIRGVINWEFKDVEEFSNMVNDIIEAEEKFKLR